MRKNQEKDWVTASEIASYSFCPEAWRLGSGLGLRPNNEGQLAQGEVFHAKTAAADVRSKATLRLGLWLIALGLLALTVLLLVLGR